VSPVQAKVIVQHDTVKFETGFAPAEEDVDGFVAVSQLQAGFIYRADVPLGNPTRVQDGQFSTAGAFVYYIPFAALPEPMVCT